MKLGRFKQTPFEVKRYVIDYSQWLDTNESLIGAINIFVDHVVTTPLTVSGATFLSNNTELVFFVSGGDDSEVYRVDIIVGTTAGQKKEDSIFFTIELPEANPLSQNTVTTQYVQIPLDPNPKFQTLNITSSPGVTPPTDAQLFINANTANVQGNGRGANERWPFQIAGADGQPVGFGVDAFAYGPGAAYGNGPTNPNPMWAGAFSVFDFRRANGSAAAPLPLKGGDFIGVLGSIGYVGGGYTATGYSYGAAQYRTYADGDWTPTNQPTRHEWLSTPQATDSLNDKVVMRLQQGLRLSGNMSPTDTPGSGDPGVGIVWPENGVKGSDGTARAAGMIGEIIKATPVALPGTSVTSNIDVALLNMSLTAGIWAITFNPVFHPAASTTINFLLASINTGANGDYLDSENFCSDNFPSGTVLGNINQKYAFTRIMSFLSTTTVKGFVFPNFGTSTMTVWGSMVARRIG
jgi:hypothetical protein